MPFNFGVTLLLFTIVACSDKQGEFFQPPTSTEAGVDYLVLASGDTNTRSVVVYNVDGTFVSYTKDFRTDVGTPRGLSYITPDEILVALDNTDKVHKLGWKGESLGIDEIFTTAGLSGAIYDMESDSDGNVYVIESNRIERYDSTGAQVGNSYINTTVGSCTLSNPRGMFLTSDNRLIVSNQGGADEILVYDVSTLTATCLSNVAVGQNPYDLVLHSDGNLYFVTQNDDQVWKANADGSGATVIFATDLTKLNNPTAIVELPNGNLAVASSATDAVWEMDTSGTIVGTTPLIYDALSLNITDMMVIYSDD